MDKNTLSQYGWVVIVIIVLIILIALATPFGSFVAESVKSSVEAFDGKAGDMFDDAGIKYVRSEFAAGPQITNYTPEQIAANSNLFAIGATQPEYVVAKLSNGGRTLTVSANGSESDGIVEEMATWHIFAEQCNMDFDEFCEYTGDLADEDYYDYIKNTSAFKVTKVNILSGITDIGFQGFIQLFNATQVSLPGTLITIEENSFMDCKHLNNVTIPNSVTEIGASAFNSCISLTNITIPDSVTSIGISAFGGCTALKSITIPNSVTSIGEYAFFECTSLESITIPDSVTIIDISTFADCTSLTSVTIPDSVTNIGIGAFQGCASLTSITIPASVTNIASLAFQYCSSLTTIKCASGSYADTWAQANGYSIEYI